MNKVILIGNLGMDPELKHTQGGQAILRMRLATSEKWVDRESGEKKEKTEWHTVIMWGKRAEGLAKFLSKGHKVCAEGSMQYRQWETDSGEKRTTAEVKAFNIEVLNSLRDGGGGGSSSGGAPPSSGGDDFDDIPFSAFDERLA